MKPSMTNEQYPHATVVPGNRFVSDDSFWVVYADEPTFYEQEGPFDTREEAEEYLADRVAESCG